jgi:hypothetical protein
VLGLGPLRGQLNALVRFAQGLRLVGRPSSWRWIGCPLVVNGQPALEARRRDAEVVRNLGHGRVGIAEDPNHVLAERPRETPSAWCTSFHHRHTPTQILCDLSVQRSPAPLLRKGVPFLAGSPVPFSDEVAAAV